MKVGKVIFVEKNISKLKSYIILIIIEYKLIKFIIKNFKT